MATEARPPTAPERRGVHWFGEHVNRLTPYIPRLQLEWLARDPGRRWLRLDGAMVFVDISGFTKLSEKLAKFGRIGAEEMADSINRCFAELLQIAYEGNGSLLKFGGDALLLLFAAQDTEDHVRQATRAAHAMRARLRTVGKLATAGGRVNLRMSVGVHAGSFDFFLVGTSHRELLVTGPATTEVVRMEGTAEAGEIVISPAVAAALPPYCIGATKGPGFLLRSAPAGEAHVASWIVPHALPDEAVRESLSVATRDHLLAGIGEPEHRRVTVAFLHFDGTDEMILRDGPEATAEELHRLVSETQAAVDEYGVCFLGSDADADGGKLILSAGAPRAMGDDEQRTLLAARKIVSGERRIPIRIGVNQGPVFAGDIGPAYRRTYTVMGDAVNLAARVMSKAPPGEIYATASVLDRSATRFDLTEIEPFMVKGKARAVQAWSVGEPLRARVGVGARTFPLVGRVVEMGVLRQALNAVRAGDLRLVDVVGESGVGKSRLAEELRAEAADFAHLRAIGEAYRSATPYIAWRSVLRDLFAIGWEDVSEVAVGRLREIAEGSDRSLLPWLPLIATAAGAEMEPTPQVRDLGAEFLRPKLHETVLAFLRATVTAPTLFEFENAHLMDEASAELLSAIATSELPDRPWLFITLRRDGAGGFVAPEVSKVSRLELAPLDEADTRSLAEAATDQQPVPEHMLRMAVERSAGNPQLLLDLLDAASSDGDDLPDSVESAATVKIDRLSSFDRQLVRRASVLGQSFHPRFLDEVLEPDAPRPDERVWDRLGEFFEVQADGYVRFRRVVVRDAAYTGLPFRIRKRLHAAFAKRLEQEVTDTDEVVGLLSLQFFLADEFDKAWTYAMRAGRKAQDIFANTEAARFYRRAIEAGKRIGVPGRDLLDALEALGEVLRRARLYREAVRANTEARALAREEPVRLARLMLRRSMIEESSGRLPQELRWLSKGRRLLNDVTSLEALGVVAEIDARYSAGLQAQGRNREAVAMAVRAIEEGEAAHADSALGYAENMLGAALSILGRPGPIDHWRKALEHFARAGDLPGQSAALNNLGAGEYFEARWSEAAELYRRAEEAAERVGDPVLAANSKMNEAEILVDQGQLGEAERLLKEASRVWRTTGDDYLMGFCLIQLGRVAAMTGRVEDAIGLLGQARARYVQAGAPRQVLEVDAREAECHVLKGEAEIALRIVGEIEPRLEVEDGVNVLTPLLERLRGHALVQLGALDDAQAAFERGAAAARERGAQHDVALCLQGLARLARLRGARAAEIEQETAVIFDHLDIRAVPAYPARPVEVTASV